MKNKMKSLLLSFYFGSLGDEQRLHVEQELLSDPETLIDYFDLKRELESAGKTPQFPSKQLFFRLQKHIRPRQKLILSVGLIATACLLFLAFFFFQSRRTYFEKTGSEILFDSNSELPMNSHVL